VRVGSVSRNHIEKGIPVTNEPDAQTREAMKVLEKETKKRFDMSARLKNRGLRTAVVTLFLDEEVGPRLGWAHDVKNSFGDTVSRLRVGVVGKIDEAGEQLVKLQKAYERGLETESTMTASNKKKMLETYESARAVFDEPVAELEKERDELTELLNKTGLTVKLRAVPPVISKDCRRKAKAKLEIDGKGIPADMQEAFNIAEQAFLMTALIQSVGDNETGDENVGLTYEEAVEMMDYLPPGQYARLDEKMAEVQFTDAISREIEGQEDFS
jgi:hypothetical protein